MRLKIHLAQLHVERLKEVKLIQHHGLTPANLLCITVFGSLIKMITKTKLNMKEFLMQFSQSIMNTMECTVSYQELLLLTKLLMRFVLINTTTLKTNV